MTHDRSKPGDPPSALHLVMQRAQHAVTPRDPVAWEREQAIAARRAARDARQRHIEQLERDHDMAVTDAVRTALITGRGLFDTKALAITRRWVAAQARARPVLVLGGETGRGKSVAAAWMAAELGGVWMRAQRAVRLWGASFGAQHDQQLQALRCHTLVLDDVGTEDEKLHPRMLIALVELLEQRKSSRHRTIITTNKSRADFGVLYDDDRLHSRMRQSAQWATATGPDLRLGQGATP